VRLTSVVCPFAFRVDRSGHYLPQGRAVKGCDCNTLHVVHTYTIRVRQGTFGSQRARR